MKTHDEFVKNLDEKITRELYEAGITDRPDSWTELYRAVRALKVAVDESVADAVMNTLYRARVAVEAAHQQEMVNLLLYCSECGMTYQGYLNDPEGSAICFDSYGHKWTRDELRIDAKHRAEVERLTQERDKYRNGIEAALDSNEATKVLKFRISGLNDELAAVKAERDALRMALDAAVTARLDGTPSGDWNNRLRNERDALAAQIAGLREALKEAKPVHYEVECHDACLDGEPDKCATLALIRKIDALLAATGGGTK